MTLYIRDRLTKGWKQMVVNERRRLTALEAPDELVPQLEAHYGRYEKWVKDNAMRSLMKVEGPLSETPSPSPELAEAPSKEAPAETAVPKESFPVRTAE